MSFASRMPDFEVLPIQQSPAWAADSGRVLLTHDVQTMIGHALRLRRSGKAMPGVVAVHQRAEIGRVIDDLVLVVECASQDELSGSELADVTVPARSITGRNMVAPKARPVKLIQSAYCRASAGEAEAQWAAVVSGTPNQKAS